MRKKCPECRSKSVRLYLNTTIDRKRKWVPTAWNCTKCNYVYTVVSDTLMYPLGGEEYQESFKGKCPKCDLKLLKIYRHKNPVHGKQEWLSTAWYCTRCKYVWLNKK